MTEIKDRVIDILETGRNATVALLRELIRIPGFSGEERPLAEWIASKLKGYGWPQVRIDGLDNVLCTLEGSQGSPTLLYNGHLDVVPLGELALWPADPLQAPVVGDRIIGRGACDMKASLAAMMAAVQAVRKAGVKLRGNLILTLVTREELGLHAGTEYAMEKNGLKADVALIGEPSNLDITLGSRGCIIVSVSVKGRASHAGNPGRGINAVVKMAKMIEAMGRMRLPVHDFFGPTTQAITQITCAPAVLNVVPHLCQIKISRRISPGDSYERTKAEFQSVIDQLRKEDPEFEAEVETDRFSPAAYWPLEESTLKRVEESARYVLGRTPGITHWFFGTDASYIGNVANIPWFGFGPGDPADAHSVNEHVKIEDLVAASKVYALIVLDLLG